jgi:hypothetical protein
MSTAVLKKPFYWLFGLCVAASGVLGLFGGMFATEWLRPSFGRLVAFLVAFPLVGALSFGLLYAPAAFGAMRRFEQERQIAAEKPLIEWGMFGIFLSPVLSFLFAVGVAIYTVWTLDPSQMR